DRDEERERQKRQPPLLYDVFSIILFIVMLSASYSLSIVDRFNEQAVMSDPLRAATSAMM
ncbi:hypothetical protein HYT05_01810, partial [Candidatus Kaiserbacteria bacterium]|nr:hypothetical protein [Candidatus Kaiserbacteria bacterium]